VGNAGDDQFNGGTGEDELLGMGGTDRLRGGAGADLLVGGLGDDRYYVDNAGDTITEATGEGFDIVFSSANYTLNAGASVELLSTESIAGTGAQSLTEKFPSPSVGTLTLV